MKEILSTAFQGKTNSSKILLDKIQAKNKLYVKNSFVTSVKELEQELSRNHYDLVISFGQLSLEVDTIQIETVARLEAKSYETKYNYSFLKQQLESKYKVKISSKTNYLCNNLYYCGLEMIERNAWKTQMLFVHIPKIKNITDIEELAKTWSGITL